VLGLWRNERFYFNSARIALKARNLATNSACLVSTENAAEAVIVEGTAAIVPDAARLARVAPATSTR